MKTITEVALPGGRAIQYYCDNYWEFLQDASREPIQPISPYQTLRASRDNDNNDSDFSGVHSFEEAMTLAKYGWKDSQIITKAKIDLPFQESKMQPHYYDVAGSIVDIERFISGDPECMIEFVPTDTIRKVLKVYIHIGYNCNIKKEVAQYRGAAIMHMIDALEHHGYSLDVFAHSLTERTHMNPYQYLNIVVGLKGAGYQVNRDILAFALCHSAFFRRLNFSIRENEDRLFHGFLKQHAYGYGCSFDMHFPDPEIDIQIPMLSSNEKSIVDTQITEALKKYGIELEKK